MQCHHSAVKRVWRYLADTRDLVLCYPHSTSSSTSDSFALSDSLILTGFTDSDYANCLDTRRSVSGYVFMLGGSCISWSSKKQQSVAVSTTEAEYMALSLASRQAVWYQHAFQQLNLPLDIHMNCDNQSGIKIAANPVHHHKTKHIDVHYHYTRECLLKNIFTLSYVPSEDNSTDLMTKGLKPDPHQYLVNCIGCTIRERVSK